MILECRSSRREASIFFDNDLLTHCVSVAGAHTAVPAHPAMHDGGRGGQPAEKVESTVEQRKEKLTEMRIAQREQDKMTKSVMLSSSRQQQVDARPGAKLDFFAPVMKLGVSAAERSRSRAKSPLVHCRFISSQYCLYSCATKDTFMTECAVLKSCCDHRQFCADLKISLLCASSYSMDLVRLNYWQAEA